MDTISGIDGRHSLLPVRLSSPDRFRLSTDGLVAFLTERGLASGEVLQELRLAHHKGKVIVPIVAKGIHSDTILSMSSERTGACVDDLRAYHRRGSLTIAGWRGG